MTAGEHVEVERTYELPDGATLPELTCLDTVASVDDPSELNLVSDYHDTADRRLLSAHTALRRRTGGTDDGWHVKVPAPPDGRLELHHPLGRSLRPPAAVRGLVAARTAGAPLHRIATVANHRTVRVLRGPDGTSLAEVCRDQVTASVPGAPDKQWTELEVELTGGDAALLDAVEKVLSAAGARVSPWSSKLERALGSRAGGEPGSAPEPDTGDAGAVVMARVSELVEDLAGWDAAVRREVPDSVHRARVTIRRLRSVLAAHRRLLDRASPDPLRAELRWFAGVLGDVRDDEVVRERLVRLLDVEAGAVERSTRRRLHRSQSTRQRRHDQALRAALRSRRHGALWSGLHALVERPPLTDKAGRRPGRELAEAIRRQLRRLDRARVRLAAAPAGPEHDLALHELRKSAKRLRYTVEVARTSGGKPARRLLERLARFQSTAGHLRDDQMAQLALHRAAGEAVADAALTGAATDDAATGDAATGDGAAAGEDVFALGHLHGVLGERVAGARAVVARAEDRLDAAKLRARLGSRLGYRLIG